MQDLIQLNVNDPVALTQQLVRVQSVSGTVGEQEILDQFEVAFRRAGYEIHADDSTPRRFLLITTANVVSSPTLLFACHVDTVPIGDRNSWRHEPFCGDVVEGRVWGRGSSDMKSGLAAAAVALIRSGSDGPPAALLLTTQEEVGCLGAIAAVGALAGLQVGAVIVPESTNNRIALGHRGALWLELVANGVAAHGGTPNLGKNALLGLAESLLDIDAHLPRGNGDPVLGATTVNVGQFVAGAAPNIVPSLATAIVDIRFSSQEEPREIRDWLKKHHPHLAVTPILEIPSLLTSADSEWIGSLLSTMAIPAAANYFTDAAVLTSQFPSAPVAVWGPGEPRLAHATDECVWVDQILEATEMYVAALSSWPSSNRAAEEGSK